MDNTYNPFTIWGKIFADLFAFNLDAAQRLVLFMDTMRERGEVSLRKKDLRDNVLRYDVELLLDGYKLSEPCNYSLVKVIPPIEAGFKKTREEACIIVPPHTRAAGIEGVMQVSQITEAWRLGFEVYYVMFDREPVIGQTVENTVDALAKYIKHVSKLHPSVSGPRVIANCQGGWLANITKLKHPELEFGLIMVGTPSSYWAGDTTDDSMRFNGAAVGGECAALLLSDISGGEVFDGADLSFGFDLHSEENALFGKWLRTYQTIDHGREKYLAMAKWVNSFCRLSRSEISWILSNLFIGNKLERGELVMGDKLLDMRDHTNLLVVMASHGDNIATPWQSLCWIPRVWNSIDQLKASGKKIVVIYHPNAGHLSIFLSEKVATEYHGVILDGMDNLSELMPGLYQATPQKDGTLAVTEITFEDLPQSIMADEEILKKAAEKSKTNLIFYETFLAPFVRKMSPIIGPIFFHLHPLRLQRYPFLWADKNPLFNFIKEIAVPLVKSNRMVVDPSGNNVFAAIARAVNENISDVINTAHDLKLKAKSEQVRRQFA